MEKLAKELGFNNVQEMHKLIANVPLTNTEELKAFEEWKKNDGTKEGILKLYENTLNNKPNNMHTLLEKYVRYIKDVEGTDYISMHDERRYVSDVKFTEEEWKILEGISAKINH